MDNFFPTLCGRSITDSSFFSFHDSLNIVLAVLVSPIVRENFVYFFYEDKKF